MSTTLKMLKDSPTLPLRFRQALQYIKKQTDWVIMPSDKSGLVVILNKHDYIAAGERMLSDDNTYILRDRGYPIKSMITAFNNWLQEIIDNMPDPSANPNSKTLAELLGRFHIEKRVEQNLGYAYFLPKVHKPYPPLEFRPIISQSASLITPLAKYVASILSPFVGTFSKAHLTNSLDFI